MKAKLTFMGLTASVLLLAASANALTITETTDFGDFGDSTLIGVLDEGIHTISGSLFTSCIATIDFFADCSSGDAQDAFEWTFSDSNLEVVSAIITITNYFSTGTLAPTSLFLGGGRIGSEFFDVDGVFDLIVGNALVFDLSGAVIEVFSGTSTPSNIQGIGDIGFDYILTLNVAPSAVPLPAAAWLFGSALFGLFGLKRRQKA